MGEVKTLPVVFLMGPTASGKTEVAARLSERFDVELVSVDAAQVYRGMDIGTAKADGEFLGRYPHHLIDVRDPLEGYSAADFVGDATRLIGEIRGRGRVPLLVGGTMFYFNALARGLSDLPEADADIRAALDLEFDEFGVVAMHGQLMAIDAVIAGRIDRHDRQRVQRALEIYRITGERPSAVMKPASPLAGPLIKMTLCSPDRGVLHQRIAGRFEQMIQEGLIEEVEGLYRGLEGEVSDARSLPCLRIVGYRQVIDFLLGEVSREQMVDNGVAATRQLAKRQLTWLRQQPGVVWFAAGEDLPIKAMGDYLAACGV